MPTKFYPNMTLLVAVFIMILAATANAQKSYILSSSKMSVEGTSSLHDWTSDVVKMDWSGKILVDGTSVKAISEVTVNIAVTDIKSSKGGMMDDKTYEAFKSEQNPTITFKLTSVAMSGNEAKANGTLTMAGVTKPIILNVSTKLLADGSVNLSGSQVINMKDFNMKPPKAVMGTIKVGEKITLLFELIVKP